jgi:hypothetical protein
VNHELVPINNEENGFQGGTRYEVVSGWPDRCASRLIGCSEPAERNHMTIIIFSLFSTTDFPDSYLLIITC